ncbi:MAG: cupredoxin domain-containing protein [Vicinamibacterales bacterium]
MTLTRRTLGLILLGTGACLLAGSASRLFAQDQAPNRRELSISARDYRFSPDRLEVMQDDLVKLTVESADVAYSFTIDEYRLSRRIPAGGKAVIEFRADQPGTFDFYSNMTSDARHSKMRGQLTVRRK